MAEKYNQKWSAELGAMLCDRLTQNPSITQAAKFGSVSPDSVFLWMRASARDQHDGVPLDQSKWAIRWPRQTDEDQTEPPLIFFHEAIILSQKLFRAIAESNLRALLADAEAGGGQLREVLDGTGKPVWEVDELKAAHALEMSDDMFELQYGEGARRDDIYKRDADGALIPKKVRDPLPSQTLIHLMRSLFGDTFNPSDRRESDVRHSVVSLVIDEKKAKPGAMSSLRADLEARLAEIRAHPDRPTAKPSGPVLLPGTGHNDPPEHVTGLADDAPSRLADHPRAYEASPSHVPRPAPSYARPTKIDSGRPGAPPAGGMKVS